MTQPSHPTSRAPPSRRGTPSTSEPLSYFGSPGTGGGSGPDFYSMLGSAAPAVAPPTTQAPVQPIPSQPAFQYGNYGRALSYGSAHQAPFEAPPRCATGPAVEHPHQGFANQAYAPSVDPYRSASVVYGGQQAAPSALAPAAWGSGGPAFFDQPANGHAAGASVSQPWRQGPYTQDQGHAHGGHHYEQPAAATAPALHQEQPAAAPVHATEAAANGVIFDQNTGQYYDSNSGQYYDSASGAWYYPQQPEQQASVAADPYAAEQQASVAVDPYAADAYAAGAAHGTVLPEQESALDGAAFFESLGSAAEAASHYQEDPATADHRQEAAATASGEQLVCSPVAVDPASAAPHVPPTISEQLNPAQEAGASWNASAAAAQGDACAYPADGAGAVAVGYAAASVSHGSPQDAAASVATGSAAVQAAFDDSTAHAEHQGALAMDPHLYIGADESGASLPVGGDSDADHVAAHESCEAGGQEAAAEPAVTTPASAQPPTPETHPTREAQVDGPAPMASTPSESAPHAVPAPTLGDKPPLSSHEPATAEATGVPDPPPAEAPYAGMEHHQHGAPCQDDKDAAAGACDTEAAWPSLEDDGLSATEEAAWPGLEDDDLFANEEPALLDVAQADPGAAAPAAASADSATTEPTAPPPAAHHDGAPDAQPVCTTADAASASLADTHLYYSQGYDAGQVSEAPPAATVEHEPLEAQPAATAPDTNGAFMAEHPLYGDGYAQDPYAASEGAAGGYAEGQQHPFVQEQQPDGAYGVYADPQGAYADPQGTYADSQGTYADQHGTYANQHGTYADQHGTYAAQQGVYADPHGTYADPQGVYANQQGAYAESHEAHADPYGVPRMADAPHFPNGTAPSARDSVDVPSGTATSRPSVSLDPQDHSRHGMDYGGGNGVSDPLGRLDSSRPIVAFGFGGSLVTMFPQQVQRFNHYGSDGALKIAPGMLCVRRIADCIPLEHCAQGLPPLASTPLLTGDTARSTLEKHRDTAIACAKAFLDSPSSAHALGPVERALYGVAVAVLRAADQPDLQSQPLHEAIDAIRPLLAQRQQPGPQEQTMQQATVPISHGSAQDVAEVEAMLLAGKRSEAIDAACRRGMWAHALIVASCTGKKDWQAIVSAYTASVLSGGFDALGAQYRLFSGMGGHAFDDPQALRQAAADSTFVTAADIDSPGTRGGPPLGHPDPGAGGAISDWARTLALALANRSPNDQAAILGLGDRLRESGQTGAAHICYVLTLQGKGLFVPESDEATPRAILLGASEVERSSGGGAPFGMAQTRYSRYYRSHTAIFLTELYELAFALRAVASGDAQAAAPAAAKILCLPHLQAYKLHRAWWLADCGQVAQASHYCDAVLDILATLPRGTAIPFIHSALVQELRNLRDRLSGAGMTSARAAEAASGGGGGGAGLAGIGGASPKSWLARAVPRPSFASLMTAFDSSIDKFIMGADGQRIPLGAGATAGKFEIGPSRTDPRHTAGPPQPLGAAAWGGTSSSPHPQVPHLPNGGSSGSMEPHAASYAPSYAPSYASPRQSLDARPGTADLYRDNSMPPRMFTPAAFSASTGDPAPNGSAQPQWGDPTMQTSAHPGWGDPTMQSSAQPQWGDPTIQSSAQPQWGDPGSAANGTEGQDGFIVPGMAFAPSATGSTPGFGTPVPPQPVASSAAPAAPAPGAGDDDEEDMFGFKKSTSAQSARPSARPSGDGPPSKAPSARQSTDAQGGSRAEDKESGGGMLGMLKSFWGGRKTQANLGEESQFVYDPVQKRWVDKSAPAGQQDAAPPPPPPPSMMRFQPQAAATPPPPPPPGGGGNGMRSMSAAPPLPASGSPSRAGTPMSTPDVASVGGRAGRRNARSRYVDLMGQ